MAAQKKNLLILFFVFQSNEILWCLRNKDIFKGFHFASGITCKGFFLQNSNVRRYRITLNVKITTCRVNPPSRLYKGGFGAATKVVFLSAC